MHRALSPNFELWLDGKISNLKNQGVKLFDSKSNLLLDSDYEGDDEELLNDSLLSMDDPRDSGIAQSGSPGSDKGQDFYKFTWGEMKDDDVVEFSQEKEMTVYTPQSTDTGTSRSGFRYATKPSKKNYDEMVAPSGGFAFNDPDENIHVYEDEWDMDSEIHEIDQSDTEEILGTQRKVTHDVDDRQTFDMRKIPDMELNDHLTEDEAMIDMDEFEFDTNSGPAQRSNPRPLDLKPIIGSGRMINQSALQHRFWKSRSNTTRLLLTATFFIVAALIFAGLTYALVKLLVHTTGP